MAAQHSKAALQELSRALAKPDQVQANSMCLLVRLPVCCAKEHEGVPLAPTACCQGAFSNC